MKSTFALTLLSLPFLATTLSIPFSKRSIFQARQSGPVLTPITFNAITISGGVAGTAEQEALAVFSALDLQNPENIDEADISFLNEVNQVANDAEKEAFNVAIEGADGDEKTALQAGKIKNKVLKLMATKIKLEAQIAQGQTELQDKLDDELDKLNNNIKTDVESAGEVSKALDFDAVISGE